jgi:hypothetical protein
MSSIRPRVRSSRAAAAFGMVSLVAIILIIGSSLRLAGAETNGPTIAMTSDTAVIETLGDTFHLVINTEAPAALDTYTGYQFEITYDPSLVTIDSNGPADTSKQSGLWGSNTCHSFWDEAAAGEPGRNATQLNCQTIESATSDVGQIGSVKFTALAPGAAIFILQPNPDATYTNSGEEIQTNDLACDGVNSAPCVVVVNILPPDLEITMSANDLTPDDQAEVEFSVTVNNLSTTTAATQVAAAIDFPAGLVPHETALQPAGCETDGQLVSCTGPDPLAPEATWVVSDATTPILATADWSDPNLPAEVVVTATVTLFEADQVTENNTFDVSIENGGAVDVSITEVTRNMYGPDLVRGDPLWFRVTIDNPSPTLDVTVTATMTLPDELIPWKGQTGTCSVDGQTISCEGIVVSANSTRIVTFFGAVDFYDPPTDIPGNICATVESDRTDPDIDNNTGCFEDPTNVAPDTAGDGYSDAHKLSLGKDPAVFCAIMRADVNRDGIVNISDISLIGNAPSDPAIPARFDQFEVQLSDGAFRPDGVIDERDYELAAIFFGRSVNDCTDLPPE